jgi:hypothetical protein
VGGILSFNPRPSCNLPGRPHPCFNPELSYFRLYYQKKGQAAAIKSNLLDYSGAACPYNQKLKNRIHAPG